jgi:hypothetical protein
MRDAGYRNARIPAGAQPRILPCSRLQPRPDVREGHAEHEAPRRSIPHGYASRCRLDARSAAGTRRNPIRRCRAACTGNGAGRPAAVRPTGEWGERTCADATKRTPFRVAASAQAMASACRPDARSAAGTRRNRTSGCRPACGRPAYVRRGRDRTARIPRRTRASGRGIRARQWRGRPDARRQHF